MQQAEPQTVLEAALSADPSVAAAIAGALRTSCGLALTLFGFDVIAARQPGTGTSPADPALVLHVVDVNYFPSYRMPGSAVLIRTALRQAFERHASQGNRLKEEAKKD